MSSPWPLASSESSSPSSNTISKPINFSTHIPEWPTHAWAVARPYTGRSSRLDRCDPSASRHGYGFVYRDENWGRARLSLIFSPQKFEVFLYCFPLCTSLLEINLILPSFLVMRHVDGYIDKSRPPSPRLSAPL